MLTYVFFFHIWAYVRDSLHLHWRRCITAQAVARIYPNVSRTPSNQSPVNLSYRGINKVKLMTGVISCSDAPLDAKWQSTPWWELGELFQWPASDSLQWLFVLLCNLGHHDGASPVCTGRQKSPAQPATRWKERKENLALIDYCRHMEADQYWTFAYSKE